jgi:hypothetical protein
MPEAQSVGERFTSRKFWALAVTLLGSAWACWWLISKLVSLCSNDHISEAVFENLVGLIITNEMLFAGLIVAWWMGANVAQKFVYLKGSAG